MKDAFWFRHDSNASRDMKLLKLKALYDFWGIGLYWSVIELLREQDEYKFQSDESGLDMVCSLVSCLDNVRFHNWFKDCLRFDLFKTENGYFFSDSLCRRMTKWEILKANGDKGGRPPKPKKEPKPKPDSKPGEEPLDKIYKNKEEYISFISLFNLITGKNFRGTQKDKTSFHTRISEGYSLPDFETAIKNCKADQYHIDNPHYLTPEFITRADKLQKYLNACPLKTITPQKNTNSGLVEVEGWVDDFGQRNR